MQWAVVPSQPIFENISLVEGSLLLITSTARRHLKKVPIVN